MSLIVSTNGMVHPRLFVPQNAPTHFEKALGAKDNLVTTEYTEKYFRSIFAQTASDVGQTWRHSNTFQDIGISQVKVPTYLIQAGYQFDFVKQGRFDKTLEGTGASYQQLQERATIQAIALRYPSACWFGIGAGEGLLNGATSFELGTDPKGNSNLFTYDPVWFRNKVLEMARLLLNGCQNRVYEINIFTSIRALNAINTMVLPLLDSQRNGGGIDTIGGVIKRMIEEAFDFKDSKLVVNMYVEPRFEGKGGNANTDLFVMLSKELGTNDSMSELEKLTNSIGEENTEHANTLMDFGAEGIKLVPIPANPLIMQGTAYSVITSGYTARKEAVIKANLALA